MTWLTRFFRNLWWIAALLAVLGSPAQAQTQVRSMEGVTEYRLADGLQVLLAPNDLQTRTYVNLVVKAGSAVEGFGEGGMAHLLEHMVFKGTPTTPDPTKAFADRSLQFNGTTSLDRTNYFAGMNPDVEKLHWYLGWLADAMTHSFIAKADLDKEMTVVRNEFERGGANPDRGAYQARMALAFPNHGYGRPTIGNRADIENVNIERLQAFYKTWYRPANMVLVVAGQFDPQNTLAHIQAVFGGLKNPATPLPKVYTREPVQDGEREAVIRRVGTEAGLLLGWRGAPASHPDDAALSVVAHALANAGGGRFKTEVEKQNLGTQVWAWHGSKQHYGMFDVGLRLREPSQIDNVQSLLLAQIAAIAQSGVTQEELQRAQIAETAALQNLQQSAESMGANLAESASQGDWRLLFWSRDAMQATTVADTQRVAQSYLVDANRVKVSFIPEAKPVRAPDPQPQALGDYVAEPLALPAGANAAGKAATGAESAMPVSVPVAPLARFEATLSEIEKRTLRSQLASGARLALLPRPAAGDALTGTLRLHWGNLETMRGQGVAPFLGGLLMKGTQSRSEAQIKDALTQLQSTLWVSTGTGGLTVDFKTTRQNWPAFALVLQEVLRQPAFSEASFKVWQQEAVASVVKQLDSPEARASNALNRALQANYTPDDPRYIPTLEESLARWQALSLADVKRFWAQFAGASVAEFAAAGALDAAQVQQDVARLLDGWHTPGGATSYARISRPFAAHASQQIMLATPDKPNALRYAAHRFAGDPWSREGMAMQLASGIMGGGASSRLYTQLRKEAGLTYGVNSALSSNDEDQVMVFGIYGTFAPENRAKFEATLQETLADIANKGLSSVELFVAKRVAADRIKQGLNSDSYIAGELANREFKDFMGQPRNAAWYEAKQTMLQSITIDEVDAAAKKLLASPAWVSVIAGDFK